MYYYTLLGAGQNFAERLLKQFNPTMTTSEAKNKAAKMFTTTKGRRVYRLRKEYMKGLIMDEDLDDKVSTKILQYNDIVIFFVCLICTVKRLFISFVKIKKIQLR